MKIDNSVIRKVIGVLIAPWLYIVVWTVPALEHSELQKWVVINTFFAYVVFLAFAGISHLVLKKLNATNMWSYCAVMFVVAVTLDIALSLWLLSGYTSSYYSQTLVVEYGSITAAGYMLLLKDALINGIISSGVMAIFWFVSIFKQSSKVINA
ncbi:hypothetical protein QWZ13_15755 [Reinekea marina]|uniref:Uncharacterized protein n=1 Tax=Reinekea marina TaxID=1310421 RepID=A0ABV7WQQ1_9GAMM|nr:hypothetical protein [Reinekea marina]MDN3650362.1 hypothetical protein [Reinekea marina]